MKASDAIRIETWIRSRVEVEWPEADYRGWESRRDGYYFHLHRHGHDLWLVVGRRAYRGLSVEELTRLLGEEHWLDRLQAERCVLVQLRGMCPALARHPHAVM